MPRPTISKLCPALLLALSCGVTDATLQAVDGDFAELDLKGVQCRKLTDPTQCSANARCFYCALTSSCLNSSQAGNRPLLRPTRARPRLPRPSCRW
jgi:hypothetical protein